MVELFEAEIAAMRDRLSTTEVQARYARGLMTATEVFGAALQAAGGSPGVLAELARQFCDSSDEPAREIGESLDDYIRRELLGEREWAAVAFEALARGESVQVRPRGHSMRGRITDGSLVTLAPCPPEELVVGEVVLARVRGWLLVLHQVISVEPGRFQIGNTAGRSDGWVSAADIFGRVVAITK